MKDISDIISILWGTFLMRDIVAKITPGAVLVAAMAVTLAKAANVSVFDKIALIGGKNKRYPDLLLCSRWSRNRCEFLCRGSGSSNCSL